MSPWRPETPGAGRLLPVPAPARSLAALRSASQGTAPALETLRTCLGSQDSSCGGEGPLQTELWWRGTMGGWPEARWPCSGCAVWVVPATPRPPSPPALGSPEEHTHLHSGSAAAAPAACFTSSSSLLLARDTLCICKASTPAPELSSELTLPAPAAGHLRLGARGRCFRPLPAGACPLHFAGMAAGRGVPTLSEVPLLKIKCQTPCKPQICYK